MARYFKRYASSEKADPTAKYKKNNDIKAPELRVVGKDGEQLGILSREEALRRAEDAELDLIEIAPKAEPPVAKIMSLSKFKFDKSKKLKDNKKKSSELKEMWFKAFIGEGDLDHKLKKVKEFIGKKNPVKLTIRAKGRVSRENITDLLDRILVKIEEYAEPDGRPKPSGRNLSVIVRPRKTKLIKEDETTEKPNISKDKPEENGKK